MTADIGTRPPSSRADWPPLPPPEPPPATRTVGLGGRRPDWWAKAACRGTGCGSWFPDERLRASDDALAVCRGCEARHDCLQHALVHGEKSGVWGGLHAVEIVRMRRRQPVGVAAPTPDPDPDAAAQRRAVNAERERTRQRRIRMDPERAERERQRKQQRNRFDYLRMREAMAADPELAEQERKRARAKYRGRRAVLLADPALMAKERARKAEGQRQRTARRRAEREAAR